MRKDDGEDDRMKRTCGNCDFWHRGDPDAPVGHCKRRAPGPMWAFAADTTTHVIRWPEMDEDETACGQWRATEKATR
jgi:hypothetical protein